MYKAGWGPCPANAVSGLGLITGRRQVWHWKRYLGGPAILCSIHPILDSSRTLTNDTRKSNRFELGVGVGVGKMIAQGPTIGQSTEGQGGGWRVVKIVGGLNLEEPDAASVRKRHA